MSLIFGTQTTVEKVCLGIVCDKCGKTILNDSEDVLEFQEVFVHRIYGGYASVWGDGVTWEIALCQQCCYELLKPYVKEVKEDENAIY